MPLFPSPMSSKLMFFRSSLKKFLAVVSIATVLVAVFSGLDFTSFNPFSPEGPRHSLTGLAGEDAPVVVVKVDDTTFAHPQIGLKEADIVYIEQVEGGLTRLAAVFSSTIPPLVGPVRSARISDIELLAQYGKVGFAFSGAQQKLIPELEAANLAIASANTFGYQIYTNDTSRVAPYAMVLKLPELIVAANERSITFEKSRNIGFTFGESTIPGFTFSSVHLSWPASSYDAEWSEKESRWMLTHNGSINLDSDGNQLGAENILIQKVSITDSIYKDKVGGVTPFSATVGEGSCTLLRDGRAIDCLWSRPSESEGTFITDLAGNPLSLSPGRTWVALLSQDPIFKGKSPADSSTK